MLRLPLSCLLVSAALLSGCDMLGVDTPEKLAAVREADGKAIGGACRHAGRAIEDCFALNKKADRAAVFAGWREMNDYMRENKIEAVAPVLTPQATPVASAKPDASEVQVEKPPSKASTGKAGKLHDS